MPDAAEAGSARTLYHCVPGPVAGDAIRPTPYRIWQQIPATVIARLGIGAARPPLLFAATRRSKALAFAMKAALSGPALNTSLPGADVEVHLCLDRPDLPDRAIDATVFAFPDPGFVDLPEDEGFQRQCVGLQAVPLAAARVTARVRSPRELMREGLQILAADAGIDAVIDELIAHAARREEEAVWDILGRRVRDGTLRWLNARLGEGADARLGRRLAA